MTLTKQFYLTFLGTFAEHPIAKEFNLTLLGTFAENLIAKQFILTLLGTFVENPILFFDPHRDPSAVEVWTKDLDFVP
jgi:hypothetical protein